MPRSLVGRIPLPSWQTYSSSNSMATVLAGFVSPVALVIEVGDPLTMNPKDFRPTCGASVQSIRHSSADINYGVLGPYKKFTTLVACASYRQRLFAREDRQISTLSAV